MQDLENSRRPLKHRLIDKMINENHVALVGPRATHTSEIRHERGAALLFSPDSAWFHMS
ncbi:MULTISPECIES: hypothetical protein [unclassified Rhizobium]|uniref:hypothetical protein n=1 Tax=unclassified Rhizobium TaxID=2613769 RepID=UPI0016085245|nr:MULTISPECIES: hypothetical protein [unclassified Rhizobium]MBB3320129.1 hypothetical protein [Rhizobium sp. BK181]MBB3545288.1 hypothetical protein [Rhizobium sp. BK399]MCS3743266.1 hypothetical protein [Rhizobium sp. BK661]